MIKPSTEQASKLGTAIQQNVVDPTKSKVQDGTLWKDVSKGATSFASTVSILHLASSGHTNARTHKLLLVLLALMWCFRWQVLERNIGEAFSHT